MRGRGGVPCALPRAFDFGSVPALLALLRAAQIDGVTKQRGSTAAMLHKIPEIIEYVSSVMTLEDGDVILTGTPEGVGPVLPGQTIRCGITGLVDLSFPVVDEADLRP